ncbi:hypothetical protein BZA05DRAFT_396406 [Tricharina praecox]|uniref:uncharacterized protein n=1 Tax=Tricharina praecox TaxID=43433 RepID=UPI00222025AC|nr:uncharacterized protein BZA05DRAFT_396406 [Tricharina praecox]KAI5853527.1 hypothetical protein BZA05DRAFT_396406 [Tricharina praecox]
MGGRYLAGAQLPLQLVAMCRWLSLAGKWCITCNSTSRRLEGSDLTKGNSPTSTAGLSKAKLFRLKYAATNVFCPR